MATLVDKLDRWAEDRRMALKVELEELDLQIRETRKAARLAPDDRPRDRRTGWRRQRSRHLKVASAEIGGGRRMPEMAAPADGDQQPSRARRETPVT